MSWRRVGRASCSELERHLPYVPLAAALRDALTRAELSGRELEHTRYARPFDVVDIPEAHYVGVADYVTVEDGTGLVHQSPAFGADDLAVARRYGLPVVIKVHGCDILCGGVGLDLSHAPERAHFAAGVPARFGAFRGLEFLEPNPWRDSSVR